MSVYVNVTEANETTVVEVNTCLSGGGSSVIEADERFNLEGSTGDTYLIYNSARSKLELHVNGSKKAEWG